VAVKRVVIDTNIYSEFMRGHESVRTELLEFDAILIPMTVLGELLYGFTNGIREEANRVQLDRFLVRKDVRLLPVSRTVAEYYARLMSTLRKSGTPLPTNDVWIAATACAEKVPLISRDRHFTKINGLQLITPE
jgi:tRNA(fMet)-specific endonuclease VapC